MGHAELQNRRHTAAEYFALEEQSETRHEFFDGEIFAMAGTSKTHNTISLNLVVGWRTTLRERGCQVFASDVKVEVEEGAHYTYPDVVVSCDPDDQRDNYLVRQPVLIVEVLSSGTAEYDRTDKFKQYQKLASLRHYVLVHQAKWFVEWFRRNDAGEWVLQLLNDTADVLEIKDLGLQMPLSELYAATGVAPLRVNPPLVEEPLVGYRRF